MARGILIRDGKTLDGKFVDERGVVPSFTFKYRRAFSEAVYDYKQANRSTGPLMMKAIVALLVPHMVDWDVEAVDDAGTVTATKPDEANLRVADWRVLEHLIDCVTGYVAAEVVAAAKN